MTFDPFNNRLCRDVRNTLSQSFVTALEGQDIRPVTDAVLVFEKTELPPYVRAYVADRAQRYEAVLEQAQEERLSAGDTLSLAGEMANVSK